MKKMIVLMAAAIGCEAVMSAELPVISAENGFKGYRMSCNCTTEKTGETIRATKIGKDMCLAFSVPRFFGSAADRVSFTYRASGTGGGGGEVFFAGPFDNFTQRKMLYVPPIIADGKWHTCDLDTTKCANDEWRRGGMISSLRLDPMNTEGGTFELKKFEVWNSKTREVAAGSDEDRAFIAKWDESKWPDVVSDIPITNGLDLAVKPKDVPVKATCSGGTVEPQKLRAGGKATFRFDFGGEVPKTGTTLELAMMAGEFAAWKIPVKVTDDMICRLSDKRWRVKFEVELPLYFDTRRYTAVLNWPALQVVGGMFPEVTFDMERVKCVPGWEKPVKSSVEKVAGIPYFAKDGKPFYAIWAAGGFYAKRPYSAPRHSSAPHDLVTLWPRPDRVWPSADTFNPVEYDNFAEHYRRTYGEDTMFMISLQLYPPHDWGAANPDDMCRDENGKINTDGFPSYSFASKKARKAMVDMVAKMIDYFEHCPYANRIYGYRLTSGHTYEWLGWDPKPYTVTLDYSPVTKAGFAKYMEEHHPEISDRSIPGKEERFTRVNGSVFADLKRNPRVKAFYDFYCGELADALIATCAKAKEMVGDRKVVGTYYGYTMTLFDCGDAMRAHYDLKRVLDSGCVDFLLSPQPYDVRQLGGICGDMKPFSSMQARGVIPALEDDTRTHVHQMRGYGYHQTPTEELTIAMMRRNMGNDLCRGQPCYTLCMNDGVNFDYPQFAHDATTLKRAGDFAIGAKVKRHAEIAVVVSEEAIKAMPRYHGPADTYGWMWQQYQADGKVKRVAETKRAPINFDNYNLLYNRISRLGAAVDYVLAEDLANAPDYKLYVFNNCSFVDLDFAKTAAKLREKDCTILWAHAPGFVANGGSDVKYMKALTGVEFEEIEGCFDPEITLKDGTKAGGTRNKGARPFFAMKNPDETIGTYTENGKPAFAVKKSGRAKVMHCGSYRLDMPVLREAVKRAGVFVFTESGDPVEANDAFFSLHARFAGRKTVKLPRKATVVDVFNHKLIAKDTDTFTFFAPLHSSWLFYFGPDADEFLRRID